MISKLIDLFLGLLEPLFDALMTGSENRSRRKAKKLAIEEIELAGLLKKFQLALTEAQTKPVSRVGGKYVNPRDRVSSLRGTVSYLQHLLDKNRQQQLRISRSLNGQLDQKPSPAWRTVGEILGDLFASLLPSTIHARVYHLECLAETLQANIADVEAKREEHKQRRWRDSYFACDRKLVQLKAQLRKTEDRIAMLREKRAFA